jgi:DNA polymerase-1
MKPTLLPPPQLPELPPPPPGDQEARRPVAAGDGPVVGESGETQRGNIQTRGEHSDKSEKPVADAVSAAGDSKGASVRDRRCVIPENINSYDLLDAAKFYREQLGWAVHPLQPHDRGHHKNRGKKPLHKGWRNHTAGAVTPEYLRKNFPKNTRNNLGVVVQGQFVHIDLDSKLDHGASVESWLQGQTELLLTPRECTAGGRHLVFICHDIPAEILALGEVQTARLNDSVTAELYTAGHNIVLSPSTHSSGHQYLWEVTGQIPHCAWADLCRWFGFRIPSAKRRGRPAKEKTWWLKFREDLRTLNLKDLMDEIHLLGQCIDKDEGKWSVICPWEHEHSGEKGAPGSDTVIFRKHGIMPGFSCLHSHCSERKFRELVEFLEEKHPGLIAKHCTAQRAWSQDQQAADGRPRIPLPGLGRADSDFCREVGACIGPRQVWFRKNQSVCSVTVKSITEKISSLVFAQVQPAEAITSVERHIETGVTWANDQGELEFKAKSMTRELAGTLLASPQFVEQLPEIIRILDVRMPVTYNGKIVLPEIGYDPRFRSYCPPDAPTPVKMDLDQALALLREIHSEFCWRDEQSVVHAIARMITPFCRGLMGWDARMPLWHYWSNRPRAGKDYLAACVQIIYEGRTCEDSPFGNDSEETRKRITAALMSGRRTMHFANCQGYVQDQALIGAITAKTFAARNLGSTDAKADLVLANEIEFSLSANAGLTFREDIEPRTRRIALEYFEENANGRNFKRPDLHGWLHANRPQVLGAVAALVRHWVKCGCPAGVTPFNSFPEWARVVGGVMTCCGLGDPCLPHEADVEIGGDRQERAMRTVYRIGYESHPDEWIAKARLFELLDAASASDDDSLTYFMVKGDMVSRETRTRIGLALRQFKGRHLDGVQLLLDDLGKGQRQRLMFEQASLNTPFDLDHIFGKVGKVGKVRNEQKGSENKFDVNDINQHYNLPEVRAEVEPSQPSQPSTPNLGTVCIPKSYHSNICQQRSGLDNIASDLAGASHIALDIETYGDRKGDGLDPWKGDIRLLTLSRHGGTIWTIDLRAIGYDLGPIKPILEESGIIAHNAKFDLLWLRVKCGLVATKVHCTLTAARLLVAGTKPGNNLDQCLERYLEIPPAADHSRSDWASMLLTDDQLAYAARDVAYLHDLLGTMETELEMAGLGTVWALESALIPCVVGMEATGIRVDRAKLKSIAAGADQQAQQATNDLRAAFGNPSINLGSPRQVLAALRASGISLESTTEEALKAADDGRLIPLVLAHRQASKRAQQATALVGHIKSDNRIHGRFEPLGTATGRFSSKEPNLQNIGRGEMREAFTAPEGHRLIVADYSQIELRAAAAIAGEPRMIEAYQAGVDLHKLTASIVLGKPESEVTKGDRQLSKAVNFGLLYGQSAKGLIRYAATSYGVTLDEDQAQSIRQAFFRTYSRLRQWHGLSHNQAKAGITEVRTRTGRRRLIPATATEWEHFTALVNTPVQGGTADGMKHALILVDQRLPKSARIVSTVHDEVVVECHEDTAEQCREIITTAMVEAMAALFPEVPVEVEANICTTWAEK